MRNIRENFLRREKEYFERRTIIEGTLVVVALAFALLLAPVRVFALGALAILFPVYLIDLDRFIDLRTEYLHTRQD